MILREVWDTEDRMLHMARVVRIDGEPRRTVLPDHLAEQVNVRPKEYKTKRKMVVLPMGGRARIVIRAREKKPFNAENHKKKSHYVGNFDLPTEGPTS